jgi:predicted transcriptional regulator
MAPETTSVRLDQDTHKTLRTIAYMTDDTMGRVVSNAVKEYVRNHSDVAIMLEVMDQAGVVMAEDTKQDD